MGKKKNVINTSGSSRIKKKSNSELFVFCTIETTIRYIELKSSIDSKLVLKLLRKITYQKVHRILKIDINQYFVLVP